MTHPRASSEDITLFRFQVFYEDTIRPLDQEELVRDRGELGAGIGEPLDIFKVGELREAVAVAALAVAAGALPRQPFDSMLESPNIKRRLSGNLDLTVILGTSSTPTVIMDPLPPITELPDLEVVQGWSEIDLDRYRYSAGPFNLEGYSTRLIFSLTDWYSSLIRQIRRSEAQRFFNAELLFSSDDRWRRRLEILASGARNWFPAWGNVDYAIWPAEGLDSYLDLADDLGAAAPPDPSGHVADFNVGQAETTSTQRVSQMIERRSLLPLMEWRFGGAALKDKVSQRVKSLEDVIAGVVSEVDVERLRPGRLTFDLHRSDPTI